MSDVNQIMKIWKKLIFLILITILNSKSTAALSLSFADAIFDIIDVFYVQQNISFDIITFGKVSSDIADVISGIGRRHGIKYNFLLKIRHVRHIKLSDLTFNQSSVIIANR